MFLVFVYVCIFKFSLSLSHDYLVYEVFFLKISDYLNATQTTISL